MNLPSRQPKDVQLHGASSWKRCEVKKEAISFSHVSDIALHVWDALDLVSDYRVPHSCIPASSQLLRLLRNGEGDIPNACSTTLGFFLERPTSRGVLFSGKRGKVVEWIYRSHNLQSLVGVQF